MKLIRVFLCFFGISACFLNGVVEAIVGGHVATYHDFRYQVTIFIGVESPRCGGGIIEENFVITAAHCVIRSHNRVIDKPISVLTGTRDLGVAGGVERVVKIFVPTMYAPHISNSPGDIAILKLQKNLDLRKNGLMALYFPRNQRKSEDNQTAKIAGIGWDNVSEQDPKIGYHTDDQLRYADAIVRTHSDCVADHRDKNITPQHLCARIRQDKNGAYRRGACIGDGGGPLVRGGKIVIGILSVTEDDCAEQYGSGIYTRISYFKAFKRNVLADNGTEIKPVERKKMHIIPL